MGNKRTKRKQRVEVGQRYGKLTVIETLGQKDGKAHYLSKCRCDCGNEFIARDTWLINGTRTQCPKCSRFEQCKHGLSHTKLFNVWQSMRARCFNPNDAQFHNYGGRGITICDEWKNDFSNFALWSMRNGYKEDLSIDRIDVDGNYEPSNCRWATFIEQARNRQNTILIDYEGQQLPIGRVAEITGIRSETIYERITKYGWSEYDATHVLPDHKEYSSKAYRTTSLTNIKTGNTKQFDTTARASRYLGYSTGYLSAKTRKLGNTFILGEWKVSVENSYYKGERNE